MPTLALRALLAGRVLLLALLALWPGTSLAQARAPVTVGEGEGQVSIVADRLQQVGGDTNLMIAVGNVEISRGAMRLLADRVEYDRDTGEAVAQGGVVFYDGQDRVIGERIDYNLRTGTGVVHRAQAFSAPYYSLSGERMDRIGESVYEVRQGVFTTCEGDDPDWAFRFGSATVDLNDVLYGRDGSFWVAGVPVIPWVPFFAAAIRRERQSGFLFPSFGLSSRKGFTARVPYFWAIDDSQDLTVALDTYTKRGVGAELEYRYILSQRASGRLAAFGVHEFLSGGQTRGWGSLRHRWQAAERLTLNVNVNAVSDDEILKDYGDRLTDRTSQRVETNVFASRYWDTWSLVGNVLWYQDLTTRRPTELQRAPELRLRGFRQPVPGAPGLFYEVESSLVHFVREVGTGGVRLDVHPRALYPIPLGGLVTVTPFAGGRLTFYDKRVVGTRATSDGRPEHPQPNDRLVIERTVDEPFVRRQVELGFEAESRVSRVYQADGLWNLQSLQHVIEPRVAGLLIRGYDQKGVPQYDRGLGERTRQELSRPIDDQGRTTEMLYSITNRLNGRTRPGPDTEATRVELASFTLSQIIGLPPHADRPLRPLHAELAFRPTALLGFRTDAAWGFYGEGLQKINAEVALNFKDVTTSVGTRFNDQPGQPEFHYVRGDIAARLTHWLQARASSAWDVNAGAPVESRLALDIQFQCWAIHLEYVNRHRNEDEVRFSVNLLGLGQLGSRVGAPF